MSLKRGEDMTLISIRLPGDKIKAERDAATLADMVSFKSACESGARVRLIVLAWFPKKPRSCVAQASRVNNDRLKCSTPLAPRDRKSRTIWLALLS